MVFTVQIVDHALCSPSMVAPAPRITSRNRRPPPTFPSPPALASLCRFSFFSTSTDSVAQKNIHITRQHGIALVALSTTRPPKRTRGRRSVVGPCSTLVASWTGEHHLLSPLDLPSAPRCLVASTRRWRVGVFFPPAEGLDPPIPRLFAPAPPFHPDVLNEGLILTPRLRRIPPKRNPLLLGPHNLDSSPCLAPWLGHFRKLDLHLELCCNAVVLLFPGRTHRQTQLTAAPIQVATVPIVAAFARFVAVHSAAASAVLLSCCCYCCRRCCK